MKFTNTAIAIAVSFLPSAASEELLGRGGLKNFHANQVEAFKHASGVNEAAMNTVSLKVHTLDTYFQN
jgi:hypothetical protein